MLRHFKVLFLTSAIACSSTAVFAANDNNRANDKVFRVPNSPVVLAKGKAGHCPPGLAKKAVPCVPPGQAKKYYRTGDYIDRDYRWINDPYRYGLTRGGSYIRAGDYVYRVDPETRKVLNLIGAVADILY
ncbi:MULTISPECIES: hypothetical protein [unclassified Ruegeria]|uniref:hypothetical protein n=1 Tax=unclassified Ruegeria TaxID=2625375 RepID=UPI0020C28E55|nr:MULTISPECIES: hypothetical protein [unclassified Ruegeria]